MALPQRPQFAEGALLGQGAKGGEPGATARPWGPGGLPLLPSFRRCWTGGFGPQILVILVGGLPITRLQPPRLGGTQHLFEGSVPLRARMKPVSYLSTGGGLSPSGPAPSHPDPFSPPFTPPTPVLPAAHGPSSSTPRCPCPATASPKGPRYPRGSLGSQLLTSPPS